MKVTRFPVAFLSLVVSLSADSLRLNTRKQVKVVGNFASKTEVIKWDAKKTAVVICDMWSKHWCASATGRVGEMAPRMNAVVETARKKGCLIIHCPSGGVKLYADTPMRKLAADAPKAETKIPLQGWCYLDDKHEAKLPIDDSDGGCDCLPKCNTKTKMDRHQVAVIKMKKGDAIPGLVGWEHHGAPANKPGLEVVAKGTVWRGGTTPAHWTATIFPGPKKNIIFNAATIW